MPNTVGFEEKLHIGVNVVLLLAVMILSAVRQRYATFSSDVRKETYKPGSPPMMNLSSAKLSLSVIS